MKIEKAIAILANHQADMPRHEVPDLIDAIRLGIEALKRIQMSRKHFSHVFPTPLPGETDDQNKGGLGA